MKIKVKKEITYSDVYRQIHHLLPVGKWIQEANYKKWENVKECLKKFLQSAGEKWEEYFEEELTIVPPHYSATYGTTTVYTNQKYIMLKKNLPHPDSIKINSPCIIEHTYSSLSEYEMWEWYELILEDGSITALKK
ncbi:hypothetical protein J7L48_08690 [bacterium]|nr:hypothetical protein [bacterium]